AGLAGYRRGGAGQADTWGDRPNVVRMTSLLTAIRAWRNIAQPAIQGAYTGSVDYNPIAAASGQPYDYGTTPSGYRSRVQVAQEYMGRGMYEAASGFLDLPYAFSGDGGTFGRAASGLQLALGVATTGSEIGYGMLQNAFFMQPGKARNELLALGQKTWKAAMGAGTAIAAGTALSEISNAGLSDVMIRGMAGLDVSRAPDEGWVSSLARGVVGSFADIPLTFQKHREMGLGGVSAAAMSAVAFSAELFSGIGGLGSKGRMAVHQVAGISRQDYLNRGYSKQFADYLSFQGETDAEKKYHADAEKLRETYGGQTESYVPILARAVPLLGLQSGQAAALLQGGAALGMDPGQYLSAIAGMGQQMGFIPGTAGMASFASNLGTLDMAGFARLQDQTGRMAQFSAQLAPYMGYQTAAAAANRLGLNSPNQVSAAQRALDLVDRYGVDVTSATGNKIWKGGYENVQIGTRQEIDARGAADIFTTDVGVGGRAPVHYYKRNTVPVYVKQRKMEDETAGDRITEWASGLQRSKGSNYVEGILGFSSALVDNGIISPDRLQATNEQLAQKFSSYTGQQMDMVGRIVSGDMGAQSWAAWNNPAMLADLGLNPDAFRWNNPTGRPTWETSGADFMRLGMARYRAGYVLNTPFAQLAQSVEYGMAGPNTNTAQMLLGTHNAGLANAFLEGGTVGMQRYMTQANWGFQLQGFDLQLDQMDAAQGYTRRMWGFEDQQRQMQYRNQMADFAYSRQRLEVNREFGERQESLSWERMTKGQEYQRWERAFNYQTGLMQRGWAREDWDFQDTTRGLNRAWDAEDLNEAIRFSTGRERRKLLRQRDRQTISNNLEDEQIDTQRERQEQLWGREDEHYRKALEYAEELIQL
ncbi:MAG: hypothetical protein ACKOC5_19770, partial [Chloroflexota bacterium]